MSHLFGQKIAYCNNLFGINLVIAISSYSLHAMGGKDKTFDQITDVPNSFVLADSLEFPIGKKLPFWLIGFL